MSRRPSDAWIGAAILLVCLSLLSTVFNVLITALMLLHLTLIGIGGLVVLHLWLKPEHGLQRLACALLTLPVLMHYGVVCTVAVFLTMWYTHVGHDFRLPAPKEPLPSGALTDA